MNNVTEQLLRLVADFKGSFKGAFNIREDGQCAGRQSSEHIKITSKEDGKPGLDIRIDPGTKGETVYIPACVTHSDVNDLVYNDFFVGADADVVIVAGCGVHADNEGEARHNGIHRFFLEPGAHVVYQEKHIGTGTGSLKRIDPITDIYLQENAVLEMDTVQLRGVDVSERSTTGKLEKGAKLIVRERILTDGKEWAKTVFDVSLDGEDCSADVVSRSVAKGESYQEFVSSIRGNNRCTGHSACDAILADHGRVNAQPALDATHLDAQLIHEAAIGKIAGEQLLKLETLGLTAEEAEERIIAGFLK